MNKIVNYFNKTTKTKKLTFLIIIITFILMFAIGIPTLARYKNRTTIKNVATWNGTIASTYKSGSGTQTSPYIISNGSELAFLAQQLLTTDYEDTYFSLSSDIMINNCVFKYDEIDGVTVFIGGQKYYLGEYSNKYYDNGNREGSESGTINLFGSLKNFKGHLDGRSFSIYGLYIADGAKDELGLFNNLQGEVKNLYIENALIYGGNITGILASTTNNASISDLMVSGYVLGSNSDSNINENISLVQSNINIQNEETDTNLVTNKNNPKFGIQNVSTHLTGNYVITGAAENEVSIKINGTPVSGGTINLDLGSDLVSNIVINTSTTSSSNPILSFSNLVYSVNYDYSSSGGIIGYSNNTVINNVINKAFVNNNYISGGLVGSASSLLEINNSYNTGVINSTNYAGGLISVLDNSTQNISFNNAYNSGSVSGLYAGGLISTAENNSGNISITNSFNASDNDYAIDIINSSSIGVMNSYILDNKNDVRVGNVTGSFTSTTINNLNSKNYILNSLLYNEFESFNDLALNPDNLWVINDNELPKLYIDDETNDLAILNSGNYSWNNYSSELNNFTLYSGLNFSIDDVDSQNPVSGKYYFISTSTTPLTKIDLENYNSWIEYNGTVNISSEGAYVIYAKIVDDDRTIYISSDILTINLSSSSVTLNLDNFSWGNYSTNISNVFINQNKTLYINIAPDSNVSNLKYFLSNAVLNINELSELSDESWNSYNNSISINNIGTYIVYIKAVDNNNIFYLNSDRIIYDGYEEKNFIVGINANNYLNETDASGRSIISFDSLYQKSNTTEIQNPKHFISSNILLPKGTIITIYDKVNFKVYKYEISSEEDIYGFNESCNENDLYCTKKASYPFTLFKEIGTSNSQDFVESSYFNEGNIKEEYSIFVDFSKTSGLVSHNDIKIFTELRDENNNILRPCLDNSIKSFSLYNNDSSIATLELESNTSIESIILNSDSSTDININSFLSNKYEGSNKILDTYFENKNISLSIKILDENNNLISRDKLKNIAFKIDDKIYSFENDNILRINLKNGSNNLEKTLNIKTYSSNNILPVGNYKIEISNYASFSGYSLEQIGEEIITVPLVVNDFIATEEYDFDVMVGDEARIIKRDVENPNIIFNIIQNGNIENPSVKVTLYKKNSLTAYNQVYSVVNLQEYTTNTLFSYTDNIYNAVINPLKYNGTPSTYNNLTLNLIINKFENNGYKFVFDLYSRNIKVGSVSKNFIVK